MTTGTDVARADGKVKYLPYNGRRLKMYGVCAMRTEREGSDGRDGNCARRKVMNLQVHRCRRYLLALCGVCVCACQRWTPQLAQTSIRMLVLLVGVILLHRVDVFSYDEYVPVRWWSEVRKTRKRTDLQMHCRPSSLTLHVGQSPVIQNHPRPSLVLLFLRFPQHPRAASAR